MIEAPPSEGSGSTLVQPDQAPIRFRLSRVLFERMLLDLARPHPIAAERVGFLTVAMGRGLDSETLVLASDYQPVRDEHYLEGKGVGARINGSAIREAMQSILDKRQGLFHVHLHEHDGIPDFSPTDRREQPRLIPGFRAVDRSRAHGMLLLSRDAANAWIWLPGESQPAIPEVISIVGYPTKLIFLHDDLVDASKTFTETVSSTSDSSNRYDRQSFLGQGSQNLIERARIAIVGLGGGGSHVVQQLAHLGFRKFRLFDGDTVAETNLNRLVGAVSADVAAATRKTVVAERIIRGLSSDAHPIGHFGRWQDKPEFLRSADFVMSCVDTFAGRQELEVTCRRYLIPLIDIGMDVNQVDGEPPRMAGQAFLSSPGRACFWCIGFLTGERLGVEAAKYGNAGNRPQVVWPNGVLASTAVGILVDLVTGWTRRQNRDVYLSYDGNVGTVTPHVRLRYLDTHSCPHFPVADVGDPVLRPVLM